MARGWTHAEIAAAIDSDAPNLRRIHLGERPGLNLRAPLRMLLESGAPSAAEEAAAAKAAVRPRGLEAEAMPPAPPPAAPEDDLGEVPRESLIDRVPGLLANEGKPLTKAEAKGLQAELIETFVDYCELLDTVITRTNKQQAECTVWRDLDDKDLGVLADAWLLRAQKAPRVATAVRQMIATRVYFKAGLIGFDAALQTLDFYRQEGGFVLWFPRAFPLPWNTSKSA